MALKVGLAQEENEQLSDMEEDEAGMYLHTPEEARLKEVIWTELNKDFLEKQAAKKAAAAALEAKVRMFWEAHGQLVRAASASIGLPRSACAPDECAQKWWRSSARRSAL